MEKGQAVDGQDTPQHGAPQYGAPQYGAPQYGVPPYRGPVPDAGLSGAAPVKLRPGRVWYLAALAVLLAGTAWLVAGLISISSQVDAFPRVPLPGGGQVTLDHSGGYVIYFEAAGAATGARIPAFNVRIVPAAAPASVASLKSYNGSVTYSFGSHQGRAVLTLQIARPGRFLVEPSGAASIAGGSDLAFGSSLAGGIVGTVLISIALIFIGVAGAIAIRIVRGRRLRAYR